MKQVLDQAIGDVRPAEPGKKHWRLVKLWTV
jgi:hypothetical protein